MLELSLDHLGLITRPEREYPEGIISDGLDRIVDKVGKGQLHLCLVIYTLLTYVQSFKSFH